MSSRNNWFVWCDRRGKYHNMWETGALNWIQFMLQWFIRLTELIEFSELLFHLGKTPLSPDEPQMARVAILNHSEVVHKRQRWQHFRHSNNNRVFPKINHSGNSATIVLEQNKFSEEITLNRDCDPRTVVLTSCVYSLPNCSNSHCLKD